MPQRETLRVEGYRELLRAFKTAERDERRELRAALRKVGDVVKTDAASRIDAKDQKTAAGYKTRVRQRGVAVEQSLPKTSGVHPEWGSYQMRHALLPALYDRQDDVERAMEQALDRMADHFNRGGPL